MKTKITLITLIIASAVATAFAQGSYKKPPKEIQDILDAPAIPASSVSPSRDKIALFEPLRYPPISELAEPMLRLAGSRINPRTNGQHRQPYSVKLTLKNIADGKETPVVFPAGAKIISPSWSPDGKYIAAGNVTAAGIELWIIDTVTAKATKVRNVQINTAYGGFGWEDSKTISATLVPAKRGTAPAYQDVVPLEPNIQETAGRSGQIATFQDLLKSPNDEKLFEYYATSQLAVIDPTGKVREIGTPAIIENADFSPDGKYILVTKTQRPFSYLFPSFRFPKKYEIWDSNGKLVKALLDTALIDNLPAQGVQTGPRGQGWIPTEPATLIWTEALDGGDPRNKATHRDKVMTLAAPFMGNANELLKTEHRFQGRSFGERDGLMFFFDYNRDTQRRLMFMTDYRNPSKVSLISDLNINDRYNDIGNP